MDLNNTELMMVALECKEAAKEEDFEARLDKCCEAAKDHWMVLDKEKQFHGAMVAAYLQSNDEEKKRIEVSLKILRTVSAMFSGVPVDINQIESLSEGAEPIAMQALFKKHFGEK